MGRADMQAAGQLNQPTQDNMITNQMVAQGQLPASQAEVYPQAQIMYPRFNPDTGYYNPGPAPQRTDGLPQNFYGAPQLPTHSPELYEELFRVGGLARGRTPAQDPAEMLRKLLGF